MSTESTNPFNNFVSLARTRLSEGVSEEEIGSELQTKGIGIDYVGYILQQAKAGPSETTDKEIKPISHYVDLARKWSNVGRPPKDILQRLKARGIGEEYGEYIMKPAGASRRDYISKWFFGGFSAIIVGLVITFGGFAFSSAMGVWIIPTGLFLSGAGMIIRGIIASFET